MQKDSSETAAAVRRLATGMGWWFLVLLFTGCAVRYYDRETGTAHLIGFGHMKLKVNAPTNDLTSVVKGIQTVGLSLGTDEEGYHFDVGWDQRVRILVMTNASVLYEWPSLANTFFTVRISSNPPSAWVEYHEPKPTEPND